MPNLWAIFVTGLLMGGVSCMVVQGGLLASALVPTGSALSMSTRTVRIAAFLVAKLAVYTILGFMLGWVGSVFTFSIPVQVALMFMASIFMLGTAGAMLDISPLFRRFLLTPPVYIRRLIRSQSQRPSVIQPIILGALTVLLPCGTTQAMMALAVSTQHPLYGGCVLAVFVLGTVPIFVALGYSITWLTQSFGRTFHIILSILITGMALWNINNALALSGSPLTFTRLTRNLYCTITFCPVEQQQPTDTVTITFHTRGYEIDNPVVSAGTAITIRLINNDGVGCIQAFTIPSYQIQKLVRMGTEETITLTTPNTPGEIPFSCSMGMYTGSLYVR